MFRFNEAKPPEQLVGGASIKVVPEGVINGQVYLRVIMYNVTSVGSGSTSNTQSFPRPLGNNGSQPYTNVSQMFEMTITVPIGDLR